MLFVFLAVDESVLSCDCIAPIAAVSCTICAITAEFVEVRTEFACFLIALSMAVY